MLSVVSRHADLDGPVHYLDFGGDGPPLVCVHGLGGSALNWTPVGAGLAAHHHVLALDLRGFGRTPLGRGTRLRDNERLLDLFLREVAGWPATLVGNSMGGLLSVRHAAKHSDTVHNLVLVDPALPWRWRRALPMYAIVAALLTPGLSERALSARVPRLGPERVVDTVLRIVCADPDRVADDVVRAHVELERDWLRSPRSQRAFAQASRSLLWALARGADSRIYGQVRPPVLIIHGDSDRLVPVVNSRLIGRLFGWQVEVLPGVGHVPMLEAPDDFVRLVLSWLGTRLGPEREQSPLAAPPGKAQQRNPPCPEGGNPPLTAPPGKARQRNPPSAA